MPMRFVPDKELITRYVGGDRLAFGVLVERYQNLVYNLALKMTGDITEAEDLTQEIFILLMRKVDSWRGEAKFSTWLYRLAVNQCRDWLRRRRPDIVSIEEADPPSNNDPLSQIEVRDLQEYIKAALLKLPPDFREAVILRDIQGFNYEEIAASLVVSLGTVKSRISRGRALLAQMLKPVWEQNREKVHLTIEDKNGMPRNKKPVV